jgi:hypothetical protein
MKQKLKKNNKLFEADIEKFHANPESKITNTEVGTTPIIMVGNEGQGYNSGYQNQDAYNSVGRTPYQIGPTSGGVNRCQQGAITNGLTVSLSRVESLEYVCLAKDFCLSPYDPVI